jgi:5-methylcytosine-specific restriction endonuclease McrA
MTTFGRSQLTDHALLSSFYARISLDRGTTAELLADLAEIDARKLYAAAGYPSMFMYCVHEHHMSEDMAYKRIQAARAARRFPVLFSALAEGRLHLTAVVLLAPHLSPDTADELIAAATHRTKAQIELLIAERFPKPDLPTLIRAIAPPAPGDQLAVRPVVPSVASKPPTCMEPLVLEPVVPSTAADAPTCMGPVSSQAASRAKVAPSSPGRFTLQLTMGQATHDLLRYAQSLLGHAVPSGDVEAVLQRALREMVERLEKQKFANCVRSRPQRGGTSSRYIPAEVQRAVWKRDNGRCTFVSEAGKRCEERTRVEYDHADPVARGGNTTTDNLRLRCRAHNQYAADCTFGAEFMRTKRQQSRDRVARAAHVAGAPECRRPSHPQLTPPAPPA